jgi:hypothetical protein
MLYLRNLWNDLKWPLAFIIGAATLVSLAILGDRLISGPPKPQPVREEVNWEVDRFQTTTVGGRKVTCFTRGSRGGLSCVPENE